MNLSLRRRSHRFNDTEPSDAVQTLRQRRFSPASLTSAWTAALVRGVVHGRAAKRVQKGYRYLQYQIVLKAIAAVVAAAAKVERQVRQRTVTVTFDADAIRVAVLRGRTVLDWRTVYSQGSPWSEGPAGGVCTPEAAAQLHALLRELQPGRSRIVVDLPLYLALTRRLKLTKMRGDYVPQVIASEVLESIPFNQSEVDISWQLRKSGEDQEVYAMAVQKAALNAYVQRLKDVKARPAAVYSRGMSLAYATEASEAIVVELEGSRASVVRVLNGIPRVVHMVEFPAGPADTNDRVELIMRGLAQMSGYNQRSGTQRAGFSLPVMVLGDGRQDRRLADTLKERLGSSVRSYATGFSSPREFPASEYAANLGLAIADAARTTKRSAKAGMFSINLLAERHMRPPLPVKPIAVFAMLFILGATGLNVVPMVEKSEERVADLEVQVTSLERQERARRLTVAQGRNLEAQIGEARQVATALESHLTTLDRSVVELLARFASVTEAQAAPQVQISAVVDQANELVLVGTSASFNGVLDYASALRQSGHFSLVQVLEVNSAEGGPDSGASFRIKASFIPASPIEEADSATSS